MGMEAKESLGTLQVVLKVCRKRERSGDANEYPAATVARPDAPKRLFHHEEDHSPGTGGAGQDWGGRRRGKEVQQALEQL